MIVLIMVQSVSGCAICF